LAMRAGSHGPSLSVCCLARLPGRSTAPFDAFLPTSLELLQAERTIAPGLASCREGSVERGLDGCMHGSLGLLPWPSANRLTSLGKVKVRLL